MRLICLFPFQSCIFLKKEFVSCSALFLYLLVQNPMVVGLAYPFVVSGEVGWQMGMDNLTYKYLSDGFNKLCFKIINTMRPQLKE